jgi:hypothetical protein
MSAMWVRTPLEWVDDSIGYRCPMCSLFVDLPKADGPTGCPRCGVPVDEAAALILTQAGFDENATINVVDALRPMLDALSGTVGSHDGKAIIEIAQATTAAAVNVEGETVTEWNILDHDTPYLQPWTEDEDEARSYTDSATGPVVCRERTTYPVQVTAWHEPA